MKRLLTSILVTFVLAAGYCYSAPRDLFEYASRGDLDSVKRYKEAGGDLHAKDIYDNNALLLSSENGYTDIVKYLLANNVEVNNMNRYGYTPIFAAVTNEHPDVIKLLLAAGADVNLKNQYNSSTLDYMHAMNADTPQQYIADLTAPGKVPSTMKGPNSYFYLKRWQKQAMTYMDEHKTELAVASTADAAAHSDAYAQYLMGKMYLDKGRTEEGLRLLSHAADHGIADAQYRLGMYYTGGYDPIDGEKGLEYLKKAAAAAHEGAVVACGRCYLLGIGTQRDAELAKSYLEKGMQMGNSDGEYYLGVMYYYALGVPADEDLGYRHMVSAADNGSAEAERQLNRFATEDTLDYLSKINELTRPEVKAYMLSQGAVQNAETADCDNYVVSGFLDADYGISEIAACFPPDAPIYMIFRVTPDMHSMYKEFMLNYQLRAPVRYDVSGDNSVK